MIEYKTITSPSEVGFTILLNRLADKGWVLKFYCYKELHTGVMEREKKEKIED